jgi:hypothetical protein
MGDNAPAVQAQTVAADQQVDRLEGNALTSQSRLLYQLKMFQSLQYFNQWLLVAYIAVFVGLHGVLLYQYVRGVPRNAVTDTVWLTVFFLYPYLIGAAERAVYDFVGLLAASVYGQVYVSNFDKLFTKTNFYNA